MGFFDFLTQDPRQRELKELHSFLAARVDPLAAGAGGLVGNLNAMSELNDAKKRRLCQAVRQDASLRDVLARVGSETNNEFGDEELSVIYDDLVKGGAGQVVGDEWVAGAAFLRTDTLEWVLRRSLLTGKSGTDVGALIVYFEDRFKGRLPNLG